MVEHGVQLRPEQARPQLLSTLFDGAIAGWRGTGPATGHIKPIHEGEGTDILFLKKRIVPKSQTAAYILDIHSSLKESEDNHRQLEVQVGTDGQEKITYKTLVPGATKPAKIHLSEEGKADLINRLNTRSRWGIEETFNPYGYLDLEKVKDEKILDTLGLGGFEIPREIKESVQKSQWFSIDNGRTMVELRNPLLLDKNLQDKKKVVTITDADDTIFAITKSHEKEYELLSKDEALHHRGINFTPEIAKQMYELSKIQVKGKAKESRYTPRLNVGLLSLISKALEEGKPLSQALEDIRQTRDEIIASENPEKQIASMFLDEDIVRVFNSNPLSDFLYKDYAADIFSKTDTEENMRVIATRGTIEGQLGQVHKLHQLKMDIEGSAQQLLNQGVDLVIYTNDLKAEALITIHQLFPSLRNKLTRIYDDNVKELQEYYDIAHEERLNLKGFEIIRVKNRFAKNAEHKLSIGKPRIRISAEEGILDDEPEQKDTLPTGSNTIYEHISPYDTIPSDEGTLIFDENSPIVPKHDTPTNRAKKLQNSPKEDPIEIKLADIRKRIAAFDKK